MPSQSRQSSPAPAVDAPSSSGGESDLGEDSSNERNARGVGANVGWDYPHLKEELEERPGGVTGEQLTAITARIARWNSGDKATLLADVVTMLRLFIKLDASQSTMTLLYLNPDLAAAVRWKLVAGGIQIDAWSRLVSGKTSAECLAALLDNNTCTILRNMGGATALQMFPNLPLDPEAMQTAISTQGQFLPWIIATDGPVRAIELGARMIEFETDQLMRDGLMTTGTYGLSLALHPSPTTDARDSRRLYNWLMASTDASEARDLFKVRFGTELADYEGRGDDASTADVDETEAAASWDRESVIRLWQICGRLPLEHVQTATRMLRESESGGASGWANASGEVGLSWGNDQIGNNEVGAYTDDDDVMRGLNIFDATIRHEIGHTVGSSNGFDAAGGFVFTTYDWQEHADFEALVDLFAGKYPLSADVGAEVSGRILGALKQVASWSTSTVDERLATWATHYSQPEIETEGKASDLYDFITSRMTGGPWNNMVDVDGRSYHVDYSPRGDWVSCPTGLYGKKVSNYAMRSPAEWFAEAYATFYADADTPNQQVGTLLKGRDASLYADMMVHVHGTEFNNLFRRTGQDIANDTMGV